MTHNNQHLVFEHVYDQRYFTINKKKLAKLDIQDKRRRQIKQKHNTICVGNHSAKTNTKNIKKNMLLQTTGDIDDICIHVCNTSIFVDLSMIIL